MHRQTLIPVASDAEQGFGCFYAGDNAELLAELRRMVDGVGDGRGANGASDNNASDNGDARNRHDRDNHVDGNHGHHGHHGHTGDRRVLYLWGEAGSGKTHLLNACCQAALSAGASHAYLPVSGPAPCAAHIERIAAQSLVCVDDFQGAAGDADWQSALFDLYEGLQARGGAKALVVAADRPPAALNLGLKDLESRLVSGGVFRAARLNDAGNMVALQARARLRGFELPDAALRFILAHYRRDSASLFALLDRIDAASLAERRRITLPFIKSLL